MMMAGSMAVKPDVFSRNLAAEESRLAAYVGKVRTLVNIAAGEVEIPEEHWDNMEKMAQDYMREARLS